MSTTIHSIISESALKILRPLVRVMIRNGISSGSLEALVRKAYVDEAFSLAEKNQQKTTVSSVSAQTGLSRKEVKRLLEQNEPQHSDVEQKYNRGIRVISGWLHDENFTDASGNARALRLDESADSFSALIKKYSGDVPTRAMLDLLIAAECVQVEADRVHLIKHAYVPGKDSAELIRILGTDGYELLSTIDYNLTADSSAKRYQRKVSTAALNNEAIASFRVLSKDKSQALLEELDDWLSNNEVEPGDDSARYVSVGIYYYEK